MNLHGYSSPDAVIENAYDLWQLGRLRYILGRWRWATSSNTRFSGGIAEPFDKILRQADLTPTALFEKFGAREFV